MKQKIKEILIDILFCGIGGMLFSLSVNMFTSPNQIAPGGFTGIATLLNYLFELPIGTMIFILNIPLFALAYKFFGRDFIFKTLIVTLYVSLIIDLTERFIPTYAGDRLLAALFGGVLSGGGLALVFLRGATTGGTDILAKLLRIKWPYISMGSVILFADLAVVIASGFVYRNIESVLYAIIVLFVSSRSIDYMLYGRGYGKVLTIFTTNGEEMAKTITDEMRRGVSIAPAKGGYTGENRSMLICAVRISEVPKLSKIIKKNDPDAFVIITEAGEIFGRGFKPI